ncbi:MAG: hypothetical protein ACYSR9_05870 [Planctomycetota bacterium]
MDQWGLNLAVKQVSGIMRIKKARWWNRLGGKPVGHAASPRFVSCQWQHYLVSSSSLPENLTFPKEPVKQKNKNFLGELFLPA